MSVTSREGISVLKMHQTENAWVSLQDPARSVTPCIPHASAAYLTVPNLKTPVGVFRRQGARHDTPCARSMEEFPLHNQGQNHLSS